MHYLVAHHLETGAEPPEYARPVWKGYLDWLNEAPPEIRHQRLHGSHYSFVDPEEARFLTPELIEATCLAGVPESIVERVRDLESQGLSQIMLYPPLNRQYRVIEDFARSGDGAAVVSGKAGPGPPSKHILTVALCRSRR